MPVVIEHLDMQIHKGEYVAFTGPSGCGKSTLLKLLMCLYPLDSGERYMAVKGGQELPLDGRFIRLFAYVPQGNHLMSGTIRQIVTFGDASQGDDKVWNALHIACADDFVHQLPEGLDTQLGERGAGLSEGQMQRLAIARAVYSDNPILMLDEATSALDEQTEKALIENLRSMTDKTVLTVTHRQAILSICDRQVVMAESGVTEVQKPEGGGCK
jgi:ATP-binding cassette subfamily B protein